MEARILFFLFLKLLEIINQMNVETIYEQQHGFEEVNTMADFRSTSTALLYRKEVCASELKGVEEGI